MRQWQFTLIDDSLNYISLLNNNSEEKQEMHVMHLCSLPWRMPIENGHRCWSTCGPTHPTLCEGEGDLSICLSIHTLLISISPVVFYVKETLKKTNKSMLSDTVTL